MKKPSGRRTSRARRPPGEGQDRAAEESVDVAIRDYLKPVRNVIEALDPQSPLRPAYERMLTFCVNARDELIALTVAGANPAIVIRLANPPLTFPFDQNKKDVGESGFETIKPPEYWQKKVKNLARSSNDLAEFMKLRIYRAAEKGQFTPLELQLSPFARICKECQTTKLAIDRLVQAIRDQHLDSGARKLTYNAPYVFLETAMVDPGSPLVEEWERLPDHSLRVAWWKRSKGIGGRGPKPDSPRREAGDGPAYAMWKYFSVRTGKPRLASVARLIMWAGWDSPVQSGDDDSAVETLRKRIEKMGQDPDVMLSLGDRITSLEVDFESRDCLDYGGFLADSGFDIEPERKK